MNIVIFGAGSWLATSFCNLCVSSDDNLFLISRNKISLSINHSHLVFDLGVEEILSEDSRLHNFLKNIDDPVYLFFGWAGTPRSSIGPNQAAIFDANQSISANYFNLVSRYSPAHVVFLSTAGAIYGSSCSSSLPWTENSLAKPVTPYGEQKLECEYLLRNKCQLLDIPCVCLRLSTAYGFNAAIPNQGVVNMWINLALKNQDLPIYNDLGSCINFISADQVVISIKDAITVKAVGVFNIGSSASTSLSEIIGQLRILLPECHIKLNYFSSEVRQFFLDSTSFYGLVGRTIQSRVLQDMDGIVSQFRSQEFY